MTVVSYLRSTQYNFVNLSAVGFYGCYSHVVFSKLHYELRLTPQGSLRECALYVTRKYHSGLIDNLLFKHELWSTYIVCDVS